MLPKDWYRNPKLCELWVELQIQRQRRFPQAKFSLWHEEVLGLRRLGIPPRKSLILSAVKFTPGLIEKCGVPNSMKWNGKENTNDSICYPCQMLYKAGIIDRPGKLRYLGEFYSGVEKVCKEFWDGDYSWTEDVEFPNYLAAWRCEVCGNEYTDGF